MQHALKIHKVLVLPKYINLISGGVFLHHVQAGCLMLKGKNVFCKRERGIWNL